MTGQHRGADAVAKSLSIAGVECVFTLSGNQIMPIFDACLETDIDLVHVRHEATTVHAADAFGRLSGIPGVALVSAGPGFANTISALSVAMAAHAPLVLLSGQSPRADSGNGGFQEMAQAEIAGHVTKASWTAEDPHNLGHDIARAFRLAKSGRPGPVHMAIPADLLTAEFESSADHSPRPDDFHPVLSLLDAQTADVVLEALSNAERPLLLAGPSLARSDGRELLDKFMEMTNVPSFCFESPRGVADPSLGAFQDVLSKADLIVLVGKNLDFTLKFGRTPFIPESCRFIHIDADSSELELTQRVLNDDQRFVLGDIADAFPALERLNLSAEKRTWAPNDWSREVATAVDYRPADWQQSRSDTDEGIHPIDVCQIVDKWLDGDQSPPSLFISDGGEFGQWAQAGISADHRVINGAAGAIGGSIAFAIGAAKAMPDARIVAMMGDGTFGFLAMEFDTAVRYGTPFVVVVGNDACWNAEYQFQLKNYGLERTIGCELNRTRYDKVVQALGGHGEYVTRQAELQSALDRAHESGLPACVNVNIQRHAAPIIRHQS